MVFQPFFYETTLSPPLVSGACLAQQGCRWGGGLHLTSAPPPLPQPGRQSPQQGDAAMLSYAVSCGVPSVAQHHEAGS